MKLPRVSGRRAARVFECAGFSFARQRGSHMVYVRGQPFARLTIPDHDELDRGTLRSLIRDSGMSVDQFVALNDRT